MNKTLIAAGIAMAFGVSTQAFANPTTNNNADTARSVRQEATATNTQGGDGSPSRHSAGGESGGDRDRVDPAWSW